MNILAWILGVIFAMMMLQCYRDEGVVALGRRNMCAKLSSTMEEYEACVKEKTMK